MSNQRRRWGRVGAEESWARTVDRSARTRNARANGPNSLEWHLARLDPALFATATDEQRHAAAESARRAYFIRIAMRSAEARRKGAA